MKVLHSIISPEAILKLVQRDYPGVGAIACELLELGCNDNYRIKTKRHHYVFRLYRYNWWPEKEIDGELHLLEILSRKKLNVSKPVRTASKKRYIKTKVAEGSRYGALFVFLPGRQLGFNFGPRNKNLLNLGSLVADMHTISGNSRLAIERWTLGFDNTVKEFLNQAPVVLGHRENDLKYLHKLSDQLEDVIFSQKENAFSIGLCHGDLHTHNVMLQPGGELALFDFDWCGYSWRAYDLATVWWSISRSNTSRQAWNAFLRGYKQNRDLTREEKKYLPWFVVLRHFEFLNFQLSMRKHIGSAWLGDNYYDHHLKFFKVWEKEHLK